MNFCCLDCGAKFLSVLMNNGQECVNLFFNIVLNVLSLWIFSILGAMNNHHIM